MLKVPAKIKKEDIVKLCGQSEKLLTGEYTIGKTVYLTEQLVFIGFQGVKVAPGIWGGDFCFRETGPNRPSDTITVSKLESYVLKPSIAPILKPAAANGAKNKK